MFDCFSVRVLKYGIAVLNVFGVKANRACLSGTCIVNPTWILSFCFCDFHVHPCFKPTTEVCLYAAALRAADVLR